MNLFAYGTLRFDEVWQRIVSGDHETLSGIADDFAIYRVDGYDFPGMTPQPGSQTDGTIYRGLSESEIDRLDAYEGDFYDRQTIQVTAGEGPPVRCEAYIVPPDGTHLLTDEAWTCQSYVARGGLQRFLQRFS